MADSKELCDAKKERDVAIAKRDAWKKRLENGSSMECKQVAQASEQLTQCQLQLELERRQVQSMATDRDNMKRWSQNAASDVMRVMEQLNKKPHVELNNQMQSLEREVQQWKDKYESMLAENETKTASARMRLKDLEDQMKSMEQLLASSERHGDLVSKISELEKTVKEQDAKLQEHSEENK